MAAPSLTLGKKCNPQNQCAGILTQGKPAAPRAGTPLHGKENAMARKKRSGSTSRSRADGTQAVRDSAQKIWLAGLGAFERARTEGPRMFEGLVEQGRNMGARAVGMADQALKGMREADYAGRWEKMEQALEEGVARSLARVGVVTRAQAEELSAQIRELNRSLQALAAAGTSPDEAKGSKRRRTARKARKGVRRTARKAASRSRAKRAS
jgi:poly(hydroxyalkanoate) granule-associated protein